MSIVEKAVDRLGSGKKGSDDRKTPAVGRPGAGNGTLGHSSEVIVDTRQVSRHGLLSVLEIPELAREFRLLKRPLLARVFGLSRSTPKTGNLVLIASDLPGSGKSFISFNLAASIAQEQITNVLLIDADPLRRNLTKALGQENSPGLLQVLADPDLEIDDVTLQTDIQSFRFIPAGQLQDNSTELLGGRRMAELLGSLDDPETVVLMDSPPLLLTSEGRVLADRVHHTLIVVEAGRSTFANIDAVLKALDEVESTISFVLNKASASEALPEKGYYYNY